MIKDQIEIFNSLAAQVITGKTFTLKITYTKQTSIESLNSAEYFVKHGSIYYNNQLKLIDRHFLKFLQGYAKLELLPTQEQPVDESLRIDFFHLIWNSIKKLSEYEVESLFVAHNEIIVSRNKEKNSLLNLPYHDQSDNIVFYYFFYKPKSIQNFLDEYEFGNPVSFYRSLLSLAIVGYLKFNFAFNVSSSSTSSSEVSMPSASTKKLNVQSEKKITGLKRILSAIKKNL